MITTCKEEIKRAIELIDFLSADGEKVIVMLEAYLDESGTHKGSPIVVVAGWLGDRKVWKSFIKEWNSHLRAAGISHFHAKDPKCESLKKPLIKAILKRNLLGVVCSVAPLEFQNNASDRYKSKLGNTYSACAYICSGLISKITKKTGHDVALVFEAGQPNGNSIHETITAIMEDTDISRHRFASIDFLSKDHPGAIPLQAADFLAHVIANGETEWIRQFKESGRLYPVRMSAEKLRTSSRKIGRMIAQQRKLRRQARREAGGNT